MRTSSLCRSFLGASDRRLQSGNLFRGLGVARVDFSLGWVTVQKLHLNYHVKRICAFLNIYIYMYMYIYIHVYIYTCSTNVVSKLWQAIEFKLLYRNLGGSHGDSTMCHADA